MNGQIKIRKEDIDILKGMDANYLTSTKDMDYKFVSRLLTLVYTQNELIEGCVKKTSNSGYKMKYKPLDATKFEFVKGLFISLAHLN